MKKELIIAIVTLTGMLQSCSNSTKSQSAEITPKEALELSKKDILFVDVRSKAEAEEVAYDVKNYINIPLDELEQNLDKLPKDQQLILVCKSGNRSGQAYDLLKEKGYSTVSSMSGGMNEWSALNYPVTSGKSCCADPTSADCNPDGTCKPKEKNTKACCADSDSKECNPDGTCEPTSKTKK